MLLMSGTIATVTSRQGRKIKAQIIVNLAAQVIKCGIIGQDRWDVSEKKSKVER